MTHILAFIGLVLIFIVIAAVSIPLSDLLIGVLVHFTDRRHAKDNSTALIDFIRNDLKSKFSDNPFQDFIDVVLEHTNSSVKKAYQDVAFKANALSVRDDYYPMELSESAKQTMAWLKAFTQSPDFASLDKSQAAQNAVIRAFGELSQELDTVKTRLNDHKYACELKTKANLTLWADQFNKLHDSNN